MRFLLPLVLVILAGCSTTIPIVSSVTTVPITKLAFPKPPKELMVPPKSFNPLPKGPVDLKSATTIIINNNALAIMDRNELIALQKWIISTEKNLEDTRNVNH